MKRICLFCLALCSLLVFMYGCSSGLKHYTRPDIDISTIKRIGILPFENFTSDEYAGEKIKRMVIMELLSRGIDVIEPGEIINTLRELKIRSLGSLGIRDIQEIGMILNVETVMMGSVETFGISRGISVSYPDVSIHLMLIDVITGNIIWSAWHTAGGASVWTRHFGAEGITLDETATKVVKEALDKFYPYAEIKKAKPMEDIAVLKTELSEKALSIKGCEDELRLKDIEITGLKADMEVLLKEKEKAIREKEEAINGIKNTYESLVAELNEKIQKCEIAVTQIRDRLSISIAEKILFNTGSAEIKKDGKEVLDSVAEILKKVSDKEIRVEGHTDNVPIRGRLAKKFPTNWELSSARATNVVRYLQEKGIDPGVLSASGYAEYRPVEPNDTEEERAMNRRIEIVLVPLHIEIEIEGD